MEAQEEPSSDRSAKARSTGTAPEHLAARVRALAPPGRPTVVGVYTGFDRRSRLAAADVARALVDAGCRVHTLRPVAVSPLPEVRDRLQQRLTAQGIESKVDMILDACPSPRQEARTLAEVLGVPYLAAHGGPP